MDKKPEKLVPEVRFKGFTDDWEQHKLGEVAERILRKNSDLQSLLPLTISAQDGLVDQTIYFNKQVASKQLKNYLLLYNGDFAYNKSYSVGYPYGAIKRLDKYKQGVLSTLYIAFKPTNINSDFLQHYYDTDKWYREIYRNAAEGARNHELLNVSANDFFNSKLITPSDNDEQLKIAKIINLFNRLITLQQRKLEQLNLLQKYVKEKTLPSQKKLPKLRFLNTPYNTYKFSELFKKSTKKNDGQILQNHVISVASMRWGKLPKSSSEAYMKTYFIFNKGDIAYEGNRSKRYSFGRFVANDLGNGIVSHVFSVFNSKINFNLEFLKNYINSEQVMRDPLRMSTSRTTMMTNLVLKDIAKQTLMIPSKNEQDLLGSLYKITQSMIELNEKQQQELIYLKKYLLQKLFI